MIGRYEEEIGIKIFDRKTKPLTITHEGKLIIQQLRLIQKEMDGLDNIIQELKGEMIGSLRLGIIPTVAPYILPLFLANFAKVFPKLRIVVQEMTTPEIVKALKNRSLDVGIAAIPLADEELLEDQLYIESFLLFDCYSKKIARKVTIDSLDYEHLLLLQEGHCLRTQVEQICKLSKINTSKTTNFEFKAGSIDSLIRYAKANKGITLLPYMSTLDLPQDDRLRLSTFISPVPVRSIGLVVHRHFVKKRILQELIKIIKLQIAPKLPTIAKQQVFNPY
jgi:LysR family hydrogen peroxide-inducible transcriptional activator